MKPIRAKWEFASANRIFAPQSENWSRRTVFARAKPATCPRELNFGRANRFFAIATRKTGAATGRKAVAGRRKTIAIRKQTVAGWRMDFAGGFIENPRYTDARREMTKLE